MILLPEQIAAGGGGAACDPAALYHSRQLVAQSEAKSRAATEPDAGRDRTSLEAQLGRPMAGVEVCRRLAKLNPSLIFEQSIAVPDRTGIYVRDERVTEGKRLICAISRGYSPEFSVVDDNGRETARGWRTVLRKLLAARLISSAQIVSAFGLPGRDSFRWQALTT